MRFWLKNNRHWRFALIGVGSLLLVAGPLGCGSQPAADPNSAQLEQELAQLREDNQELQRLRAENQELARLRKDNEELKRLSEQTKDLESLRKEHAQLQTQLQILKQPKPRK